MTALPDNHNLIPAHSCNMTAFRFLKQYTDLAIHVCNWSICAKYRAVHCGFQYRSRRCYDHPPLQIIGLDVGNKDYGQVILVTKLLSCVSLHHFKTILFMIAVLTSFIYFVFMLGIYKSIR